MKLAGIFFPISNFWLLIGTQTESRKTFLSVARGWQVYKLHHDQIRTTVLQFRMLRDSQFSFSWALFNDHCSGPYFPEWMLSLESTFCVMKSTSARLKPLRPTRQMNIEGKVILLKAFTAWILQRLIKFESFWSLHTVLMKELLAKRNKINLQWHPWVCPF